MPLDTSYFDLTLETRIHQLNCEVYRPDDLLLGNPFYVFKNEGTASNARFSSTPSARGMDTTTTDLKLVLNSSLPNRLVLSRQFIGWRSRIFAESTDGTDTGKLPLFTGVITSANIVGVNTTIEITSQAVLLKGKPPVVLSNNCPLIFGSSACGQSKQTIWTRVNNLAGNRLEFSNPIPLVVNPRSLYAVEIGDQSIRVVSFVINSPSTISGVNLELAPSARPDTVAVVRSCNQTIQQCRNYNNANRYRASVLPRSPLATR